jgi:hypothetical protein
MVSKQSSPTSLSGHFLVAGVGFAAFLYSTSMEHEFGWIHNNNMMTTTTGCHCQVPCGIFDDPAMINELKQYALTIRKAISQGNELHGHYVDTTSLNANQFVRWVLTKEDHANKIITTIGEYCLCQRVKPSEFISEADYLQALKIHHTVMQAAMKTKQSMDLKSCEELEHAIDDLAKIYTPTVATTIA